MPAPKVKLYLSEVSLKVKEATDEGLTALALQIEERTKVNIAGNGQIDTGFMLNSVYAMSVLHDGYAGAVGQATSKAERSVTHVSAGVFTDQIRAAVVVGANYAIFQEARASFLHSAGEQVAASAGATLQAIYDQRIGRK